MIRRLIIATGIAALALALPVMAEARPGDIYIGDSTDGKVLRFGPNGGTSFATVSSDPLLVEPNSIEFAPDGRLLVLDYGALGGDGALFSINRRTGAATVAAQSAPLFQQPDGMALGFNGRAYISDLEADGGSILEVNLATGAVRKVRSGPPIPSTLGIEVARNGTLLAANGSSSSLFRVNPATGAPTLLAGPGTGNPFVSLEAFTRTPEGNLYGIDGSNIVKINVKTGKWTTLALTGPVDANGYDITLDLNGNLLVTGDDLVRVNLQTGQVETLIPVGTVGYAEGVRVEPPRCAGKVPTIVGTTRSERIVGSPRRDVIAGLGGRDVIFALGGNDLVCAGPGPDHVRGGSGVDRLLGQAGPDNLRGERGRDVLKGQRGRDRLNGGPGRDRCIGDVARQRSC